MRKISALLMIVILLASASCNKMGKAKLADEKDTVTYFIGLSVAKSLKRDMSNADIAKVKPEVLARAFTEVFAGDSIKFNDEQIGKKIQSYLEKLHKEASDKNLKEGKEFLEKNKKNPGVVVLPSGVQYIELKKGTGPRPDSSSLVNLNYKGTLINGEVFDSNEGRGPLKMPATGFIKGFTEAVLMMNVGSKWKVFIPSELGYGERVQPGSKLKSNMALVFEVELLGIEDKPKTENPQPVMPEIKKYQAGKK